MNLSKLLNQVLNSSVVNQVKQKAESSGSSLGGNDALKNLGLGAVGGGLLTSLLKSGKGSSLLKVGGAAAIGALAYKVYNDYQAEKANPNQMETFQENDQDHPVIILKAMIAAAKSDGHIDQDEMARINEALAKSNLSINEKGFLEKEINKPLDPKEIASMAKNPAMASEIYLASLLVIDEENHMETMYLKELSRLLNLDDEVVQRLALSSIE
jgi:uncharacterized membrane protein YebE (DUF533 family)